MWKYRNSRQGLGEKSPHPFGSIQFDVSKNNVDSHRFVSPAAYGYHLAIVDGAALLTVTVVVRMKNDQGCNEHGSKDDEMEEQAWKERKRWKLFQLDATPFCVATEANTQIIARV